MSSDEIVCNRLDNIRSILNNSIKNTERISENKINYVKITGFGSIENGIIEFESKSKIKMIKKLTSRDGTRLTLEIKYDGKS